jgi:hypothetical protein
MKLTNTKGFQAVVTRFCNRFDFERESISHAELADTCPMFLSEGQLADRVWRRRIRRVAMAAFGPKQTRRSATAAAAFGG